MADHLIQHLEWLENRNKELHEALEALITECEDYDAPQTDHRGEFSEETVMYHVKSVLARQPKAEGGE